MQHEIEIANEIMSNGRTNEQLSIEYEVKKVFDSEWGWQERYVKLKIKRFTKKIKESKSFC